MASLSNETVAAAFRQRDNRIQSIEAAASAEADGDPVLGRVGITELRLQAAARRQTLIERTQGEIGRLGTSH